MNHSEYTHSRSEISNGVNPEKFSPEHESLASEFPADLAVRVFSHGERGPSDPEIRRRWQRDILNDFLRNAKPKQK